jgi:di/tricarboxylate transporter
VTIETLFVFFLVLCAFGAMVWEKVSVDLVAMLAFSALLVAGILTPAEAFSVFSNDAAITIAGLFVVSGALERTGAIEAIGRFLQRIGGKTDLSLLLLVLPIVAILSAFVNNTPIVVVFLPIMISLAAQRQIRSSRLLIPLSYAAIFGGTCTLIGTSTNLLVSSTAAKLGAEPLSMFELTPLAVILGAAGLLYLLTIGRKLLPERETLAALLQTTESRQYLTEAAIAQGSPLVGKKLEQTPLKGLPNSRILDVTRGGDVLKTPLNEIVLEQGDRLRLTTVLSTMMEIKELKGLELLPYANLGLETVGVQKAMFVECMIGPDSELIGRTLREINFRQRFGVLILAIHREGVNLRENFENVPLRIGDTLLIEGGQAAIQQLRENRNLLMLVDVPRVARRRPRMWIPALTLLAIVVLATANVLPIAVLALIGALTVVLTGCLAVEEAYRAINWRIIFLIFGMLSLGMALEKTHGASLIAETLIGAVQWVPPHLQPWVMLSLVYFMTSLLTEFLSNNAVAVLLTPVAIDVALALNVDLRPFIVAVAIGASASFATPIGYQTNTLVYGAGGYLFRDFLKIGTPLNLMFWVLATLLIPVFWPF